jgi:hypothetical protein
VLGLLQKFSGTDPLKAVFRSKPNYDRVNQRVARQKWPEAAAAALADDPTLIASGGNDNDFQILYCRLSKDRLSLVNERTVASRLLNLKTAVDGR